MMACFKLGAVAPAGGIFAGEESCSVFANGGMVCDESCCAGTGGVGDANDF